MKLDNSGKLLERCKDVIRALEVCADEELPCSVCPFDGDCSAKKWEPLVFRRAVAALKDMRLLWQDTILGQHDAEQRAERLQGQVNELSGRLFRAEFLAAPAAEAAPRPEGPGIWEHAGGAFRCSGCHRLASVADIRLARFCPRCGKPMVGYVSPIGTFDGAPDGCPPGSRQPDQ